MVSLALSRHNLQILQEVTWHGQKVVPVHNRCVKPQINFKCVYRLHTWDDWTFEDLSYFIFGPKQASCFPLLSFSMLRLDNLGSSFFFSTPMGVALEVCLGLGVTGPFGNFHLQWLALLCLWLAHPDDLTRTNFTHHAPTQWIKVMSTCQSKVAWVMPSPVWDWYVDRTVTFPLNAINPRNIEMIPYHFSSRKFPKGS